MVKGRESGTVRIVMDTRATTHQRNPHQKGANDDEDGEQEHASAPSSTTARCCCLLVLFLLCLLVLLCAAFVLLLKPKKPFFSLHSVQIDPFHLNVSSSKEVYIPASTATLSFLTGNPNKYGVVYSSSALGVVTDDGTDVGVIRVPEFYQPPRSRNVSVPMRFSFGRLDLVKLTHGGLLNSSYGGPRVVSARVAGRVGARVHVLNFSLPKIKVAINCQVTVNYGAITFSKAMKVLRTRKVHYYVPSFCGEIREVIGPPEHMHRRCTSDDPRSPSWERRRTHQTSCHYCSSGRTWNGNRGLDTGPATEFLKS